MKGVGLGLTGGTGGGTLPSFPINVETETNRRIEQFEGIGYMGAVGAILGGGVSITNIQLPDGTILPPLKPSISIGIAGGVSVFNSMTIWDLVYTF